MYIKIEPFVHVFVVCVHHTCVFTVWCVSVCTCVNMCTCVHICDDAWPAPVPCCAELRCHDAVLWGETSSSVSSCDAQCVYV